MLAANTRNPTAGPQHPQKTLVTAAHSSNPSAGTQTGEFLKLTGQTVRLVSELQVLGETSL